MPRQPLACPASCHVHWRPRAWIQSRAVDEIDQHFSVPSTYPFNEGDELLSVDGRSVARWAAKLAPYAVNGEANSVSRSRLAIGTMLDRYQGGYTYASKVQPGDTATIVMKSGGKTASYSLSWEGFGIPLVFLDLAGHQADHGLRCRHRWRWRQRGFLRLQCSALLGRFGAGDAIDRGTQPHVFAPGLPPAPYIENIGVQPDVVANYQTKANLFIGGAPFVNGFSSVIGNWAKNSH